jgi:3-deoxy-manno-octulosonate cytidylyltransferase (CMP-KDO synthetase)
MTAKRFIGIIPARYASSRFPGKPLVLIGDKPMIQRVYERALLALETVFVATDDVRILEAVQAFGGNVVMTSDQHKSGTDRCAEAVALIEMNQGCTFDIVLNVQGDEPFLEPVQLRMIMECFDDENTQIATLVKPVHTIEELTDPNRPKVVLNKRGEAMYFSRAVIPYQRDVSLGDWLTSHRAYYKHIGLYGFNRQVLQKLCCLEPSALEKAESLEQLRWLENGFRILTGITEGESYGIDTPQDLERIRSHFPDIFL